MVSITSSAGIANVIPAIAISMAASAMAAPVALRKTHGSSTSPPSRSHTRPSVLHRALHYVERAPEHIANLADGPALVLGFGFERELRERDLSGLGVPHGVGERLVHGYKVVSGRSPSGTPLREVRW